MRVLTAARSLSKPGKNGGGAVFTAPDGPVYPNTEWHPHICDPTAAYKVRTDATKRANLHATHEFDTANIGQLTVHHVGEDRAAASFVSAMHDAAARSTLEFADDMAVPDAQFR
jgi:hypothetical protein